MKKIFALFPIAILFTILSFGQTKINAEEASKHYGETVTICDRIYGVELVENARAHPAIKVGNAARKSRLSVLLSVESLQKLTEQGKNSIINKNVCITGKVIQNHGVPEILVSRPDEIFLIREGGGSSDIMPNDFMKFE
jgi:hypothetical protein